MSIRCTTGQKRGTITLRLGPLEAEAVGDAIGAWFSMREGESWDRYHWRIGKALDAAHSKLIRAEIEKGWK